MVELSVWLFGFGPLLIAITGIVLSLKWPKSLQYTVKVLTRGVLFASILGLPAMVWFTSSKYASEPNAIALISAFYADFRAYWFQIVTLVLESDKKEKTSQFILIGFSVFALVVGAFCTWLISVPPIRNFAFMIPLGVLIRFVLHGNFQKQSVTETHQPTTVRLPELAEIGAAKKRFWVAFIPYVLFLSAVSSLVALLLSDINYIPTDFIYFLQIGIATLPESGHACFTSCGKYLHEWEKLKTAYNSDISRARNGDFLWLEGNEDRRQNLIATQDESQFD
jgi:hypothetical protein